MATYYSDVARPGLPARENAEGAQVVPFLVTLTTALAAADVIKLVKIPNFAELTDFVIEPSDMDTHATPTLQFNVGDEGDVDRYVAASTAPQTGARIEGHEESIATRLPFYYSNTPTATGVEEADDASGVRHLQITIPADQGPATWANGTIRGHATYVCGKMKYVAP